MRVEDGVIHVDSVRELLMVLEDLDDIQTIPCEDCDCGLDEEQALDDAWESLDNERAFEIEGFELGATVTENQAQYVGELETRVKELIQQNDQLIDEQVDTSQRYEMVYDDYLRANQEAVSCCQQRDVLVKLYREAAVEIQRLTAQVETLKAQIRSMQADSGSATSFDIFG